MNKSDKNLMKMNQKKSKKWNKKFQKIKKKMKIYHLKT